MASQKIKFTVGLFLTCGILIALMAFIWLGVSRVFEKGNYYVTYFNESVQGLEVDSAVKYRGVAIGRVESIRVAPDSKLIEVVLKIETGQKLNEDSVAQLKSVGITGSMFVELGQKKEGEPDRSPVLGFPSEYPIISSKPSSISEIMQGIDDVLSQVRALDLEGISGKIKFTMDNMNRMMADADVKTISADIQTSLKDIGRIVDRERWDRIIASVEDAGRSLDHVMARADTVMVSVEDAVQTLNTVMDRTDNSVGHAENSLARIEKLVVNKGQTAEKAIDDFTLAIEKTNRLLDKGTLLVDNTDESVYQLGRYLAMIARNLEKASENLNRLIEQVRDHPSQLLFGEPPAPRRPEE